MRAQENTPTPSPRRKAESAKEGEQMATKRQEMAEVARMLAELTPRQTAVLAELIREAAKVAETPPLTEKRERARLEKLFEGMPENKKRLVEGLITQAARLRVRLNELHADIEENGMTELFQQSEKVEPYSRERPEAGLWIKLDKNYQAIIRQLTELVPPDERKTDDLDAFLNGDG